MHARITRSPRLSLLALAMIVTPLSAQETLPNDYGDDDSWLCRPDRDDYCTVDLTTTIVEADGSLAFERWQADPYAPIDCFYVYPTVSRDETGNADMNPGPGERGVIAAQFARFASVCRPYAPLYRQFTLTALRSRMSGGTLRGDPNVGYQDVVDAWNHYLEHDNGGRGVVLIGHSQGAGVLLRMIAEEIDGTEIQDVLVSAVLMGTNVQVPPGEDVGGSFDELPLCRAPDQTGCIVTFSTYRSTLPPDERGIFGRGAPAGTVAGCTNPAALAGGRADLHSYLGAGNAPAEGGWTTDDPAIETGFVSTPGLLTGECITRDGFSYLEITVNADPADARTDDIGGDVMLYGQPSAAWGLHLIDVAVAMGDLVDLIGRQAQAFLEGS